METDSDGERLICVVIGGRCYCRLDDKPDVTDLIMT